MTVDHIRRRSRRAQCPVLASTMSNRVVWTLLGLLSVAVLGLLLYMLVDQPQGHWMVVAAGLQALATIALVWVTTHYAGMVKQQADAAEDSAYAAAQSAEATRKLAELEARVARQEMVADLEVLRSSIARTRDVVDTWIHNSPPWQKIKNGRSEPSALGRGDWDDRHQTARKAIAGLRISDDRRKFLTQTVTQADEVREAIGAIRGVLAEDRNPVEETNAVEGDVQGLRNRLNQALTQVEGLRDEFVSRPQ